MKKLFFPTANRITRKQFWMAQVGYLIVSMVTALVFMLLGRIIPNQATEAGEYSVNGFASVPFAIIGFGVSLTMFISGILVGIKRLHDRHKGGGWLFIILIPIVGQIWLLIELGFLAGTQGQNRFGPDPRSALQAASGSFSVAR